jgi:hypothetical protein
MLPTPAQNRLYRHIPGNDALPDAERRPLNIDYYTFDGEYIQASPTLDVFWAEEDYTPTYPCVAMELDPTAVQRYDGNTLTDWARKKARPDDPTIAYERVEGTELYDVLTLTVAVRDDYVTDRGKRIRRSAFAKELTQALFTAFRFESEYLNEPGVAADGTPLYGDDAPVEANDWAQPMQIDPMPGTGVTRAAAMVDEQHIDRYEMQFRVSYKLTHSVLVDAVAALDYDVYIDGKPATREQVSTATPLVATAVFPTNGTRG